MEKDSEAIFIIGCHRKGTARLDRFQGYIDIGQGELWAFQRAALGLKGWRLEERASRPSGEGQERSGWGRGGKQWGGSGPRGEARNRFHQA